MQRPVSVLGLFSQRKAAFNRGVVTNVLKLEKKKEQDKIETELRSNNPKAAWNGMEKKTNITGCYGRGNKEVSHGYSSSI